MYFKIVWQGHCRKIKKVPDNIDATAQTNHYSTLFDCHTGILQRHLAAKLLLICNIEKMTENALPSICQKIINLQPLLCSSLKNR
jgi:hypothetical protein